MNPNLTVKATKPKADCFWALTVQCAMRELLLVALINDNGAVILSDCCGDAM